MAEIAAAKTRGQRVVGEAVASGFGADEGKIWDPDFKVGAPVQPALFFFCLEHPCSEPAQSPQSG